MPTPARLNGVDDRDSGHLRPRSGPDCPFSAGSGPVDRSAGPVPSAVLAQIDRPVVVRTVQIDRPAGSCCPYRS